MKRPVDPQALGARIVRRRKKLDISQTALAQAVGMKQQGIASIENGKVERPHLLREIATVLGTTQDWLSWEEGPEESAESLVQFCQELSQKLSPSEQARAMRLLKAAFDEDAA
jgi:transcriptional regulator with XRE-family HTH domain